MFFKCEAKKTRKKVRFIKCEAKNKQKLRSLSGELPCPGPAEEVELCQVDISLITLFVGTNFILIILIITILSSLFCHHCLVIILGTIIYNAIYTRM